jgi:hypothetical protein
VYGIYEVFQDVAKGDSPITLCAFSFPISVEGVQTVSLPTSLVWLAHFACQQAMGNLHAHKTDHDRHFERFSRKRKLVIQLQPKYCISIKRNKPQNKVKRLYVSIHGLAVS